LAKKLAFLTQTKGNFAEKVITTLVFDFKKPAIFCCQKLAKIAKLVIIKSAQTPLLCYGKVRSFAQDVKMFQ
jgi:hypothetical protein